MISIITINRNNAIELEKTIHSVVEQTDRDFEFIIVDGASTDDSVDVINRLSCSCSNLKWISEPDNGIYNAMNKGIAMATGDYLYFLNSGDTFCNNDVIAGIASALHDVDFVIGRINLVYKGEITGQSKMLEESDLSLYNMFIKGIPHQAAFIRRQLLMDNPYDESLIINSDWKFFMQSIVFDNARVSFISNIIADFDTTGVSSTNIELLLKEREYVFKQLLPERISSDYLKVFPHYYEVNRVKWLLGHPLFYKVYRFITSLGMILSR